MKTYNIFFLNSINALVFAFGISASALATNSSYSPDRWECPGTVKCKTKQGSVKYPAIGVGETMRAAKNDCLAKLLAWGEPTCVSPGQYSVNLCKKAAL